MDDFKKGDKVAIPSHKIGKDGTCMESIIIGTVHVVGKFDLMVAPKKAKYSFSDCIFCVPKKRCTRIRLEEITPDSLITKPIIGDLVLHSKTEYSSGKIRETSGIVREIIDPPWGIKRAKVMTGDKVEEFGYDNLIVLERN